MQIHGCLYKKKKKIIFYYFYYYLLLHNRGSMQLKVNSIINYFIIMSFVPCHTLIYSAIKYSY